MHVVKRLLKKVSKLALEQAEACEIRWLTSRKVNA